VTTPFDTVAASFWDAGSTYGMLPPLTPEGVAGAERILGVRLPEDLLRLLRVRNGGRVAEAWDAFPYGSDDYVAFDRMDGIGEPGKDDTSALTDTPYLVKEWELPAGVVLLCGDGHTWVALDYRSCGSSGEPSVVFLDTETRGGSAEVPLAPSFRGFVEGLMPTPES
jgi:hypothetical protein